MYELALYNEIDPNAADWLENLIRGGHIAPGRVERRSIVDLTPDDVAPYRQVHFFAGIGVWSYALRKAGWSDDKPIWTGSCPCQPFSAAGKGGGFDDERHLWPHFHYLIEQCRPPVVLGEQVASKDGLGWLDLVQSDLEGTGYACGAVDTCSASVGAPHIRQRLRFAAVRMAYATDARQFGRRSSEASNGRDTPRFEPERLCDAVGMGHAVGEGLEGHSGHGDYGNQPGRVGTLASGHAATSGGNGGLADTTASGWREERADSGRVFSGDRAEGQPAGLVSSGCVDRPRPTNGFWSNPDWLYCRDGKWRPVESGTFPLAHGAPARVGRLRAYGNAVDAEATREFCEAAISFIDA